MSDDPHWAHVRIDADTGQVVPHFLYDHLLDVASGASVNAEGFAADWAGFAGLWHDLGKYRVGFKRYIRQANAIDAHIEGRVKDRDKTHSAAGAIWAERLLVERFGMQGRMMARALQYAIAGHHAGLDNWHGGLSERLASADAQRECDEALAANPPNEVLHPKGLPDSVRSLPLCDEKTDIPGRFALW
jgi:CRISPR-associated endonuclease/helicase Cas3